MDIRSLRFCLTLAEELHFGRAARRRHIAAQPFGRIIQSLESTLGYRLFERTSRRVSVTARGAIFLVEARRVVESFDALAGELGPSRRDDRLVLGVLGFGLGALWSAFHQALSDVLPRVSLGFEELDLEDQYDAVVTGRVDAGVVHDTGPVEGLELIGVLSSPRVVVVPRSSPLADAAHLRLADVADASWVSVGMKGTALATWLGDPWTARSGDDRIRHPAAIPAAVAATRRLAVFADLGRVFFPHPGVRYIPAEGAPCQVAIAVRTGDHRASTEAIRRIARMIGATHERDRNLIDC